MSSTPSAPLPANALPIGGTAHEERAGPWWVLLYSALWLVGLVVLNLGLVGVMLLMVFTSGEPKPIAQLMAMSEDFPPNLLIGMLTLQFPMMLLLAEVAERWLGWSYNRRVEAQGSAWAWTPVSREVRYAMLPAAPVAFAFAAVIGLTTGWLPGLIAEHLREWMVSIWPGYAGTVGMINKSLTSGNAAQQILLAAHIALVAPLVEELVFRGVMWHQLQARFDRRGVVAFVGTSVLFAVYHMDPVQGTALLFTAFTLGWVRWVTGSVWPCVLVHVINNSLGVAAAHLLGENGAWGDSAMAQDGLPLAVVLGCAALSVASSIGLYQVLGGFRPAPSVR